MHERAGVGLLGNIIDGPAIILVGALVWRVDADALAFLFARSISIRSSAVPSARTPDGSNDRARTGALAGPPDPVDVELPGYVAHARADPFPGTKSNGTLCQGYPFEAIK